ncbi:PREDICTED: armadillo repeat-containing protein 3-like [Dufourea novaeangliae]|uniref:armadillo repeat-containing protein 3-like n=1 Tax=Dufourea novaeangliae TaxID=178035 RepID=UPI0007674A25|nr:PREDICTED: armadillo repeat-containing protein 3-like [Dufourea novaeangliae]
MFKYSLTRRVGHRFAAKLLAEMIGIPNVRNFLMDTGYYILHFTKVLINDKDLFMQEFSSLILAEISNDMFGAAQLLKECPHMNFLFERFQSPDPDVKRNNLQIMYNILQDPIGAIAIINTKNFNLNLIYDLYDSPYPEIQRLALKIVADLVSRNQDDSMQDNFRRSNGLQALMKFLDALYSYGIIDHLVHTVQGNMQASVYEISCHGIGMMALYAEAAKELTDSNCMKNILDILKTETFKWTVRQAAMFALTQLLKCDIQNCHDFLDIQGQNYLIWLMKQTVEKVPIEILIGAVECLTTIAKNQSLRSSIISTDVIDVICTSFELTCPITTDYKIACCNALSVLCMDNVGRSAFLKVHGPSRLYNLLCDVRSIPIRNAAAQIVQLLCVDPVLADAFVQARYLN